MNLFGQFHFLPIAIVRLVLKFDSHGANMLPLEVSFAGWLGWLTPPRGCVAMALRWGYRACNCTLGCIKTNLAVFGGMNIHLLVIWGSLGYQGFDSYPHSGEVATCTRHRSHPQDHRPCQLSLSIAAEVSPIVDAPLTLPGRQVGTGKHGCWYCHFCLASFWLIFPVHYVHSAGKERSEQVRPRGARDAQSPSTATCAAEGSTVQARRGFWP